MTLLEHLGSIWRNGLRGWWYYRQLHRRLAQAQRHPDAW